MTNRVERSLAGIVIAVLGGLLAGPTMAGDVGPGAAERLRQLFAGRQVVAAARFDPATDNSINSFLIEFNADGSLSAVHRLDYFPTSQWGTGGTTDVGSWSVEDGRLCTRFAKWDSGQKRGRPCERRSPPCGVSRTKGRYLSLCRRRR